MEKANLIHQTVFHEELPVDTAEVVDGAVTEDFTGERNEVIGVATGDKDYAFLYLHEEDRVIPVELPHTPPVLQ